MMSTESGRADDAAHGMSGAARYGLTAGLRVEEAALIADALACCMPLKGHGTGVIQGNPKCSPLNLLKNPLKNPLTEAYAQGTLRRSLSSRFASTDAVLTDWHACATRHEDA